MFRGAFISLIAALAFPLISTASDSAYSPGASIKGRSVPMLTTEWWQWAMSAPDETNPVRDLTGSNCGVGQKGAVWFLAGGFGSSKIHRVCTVPEGRALFFPLVNMVYWPRSDNLSFTCDQAKVSAAINNETALDLFAEIDGTAVGDLKQYRVSSDKCFDVFARIPSNHRPYNAFPSASDGYWLLVKPLKKGRHTLKFGGRYNESSSAYGRMVQDIEYELIVR